MKKEDKKKIILYGGILAAVVGVAILLGVLVNHGNQSTSNQEDNKVKTEQTDSEESQNTDVDEDTIQNIALEEKVGSTDGQNTGNYRNDKVLSYTYDSEGHTISVGMKNGGDANYIYLNLKDSSGSSMGYYISSERCYVETSTPDTECGTFYDDRFANISNFMITGQTYDTLVPAEYVSDDEFGVRWQNDYLYDGQRDTGDVLTIRAVTIASCTLKAILQLKIDYVDDHFEITELTSADVYDTKEITADERNESIDRAVEFLQTKAAMDHSAVSDSEWLYAKQHAIVHHCGNPYFVNFYNTSNFGDNRIHYAYYDTYAVNLSVPGYGLITVYVAPWAQTNGFLKEIVDCEEFVPSVFGYDALFPSSQDTLFVDDNFYVN